MSQLKAKFTRLLCIIIGALSAAWAAPQYARELTHRIYQEHYSAKEARYADTVINHMRMASRAGYNGVMFSGPFTVDNIEKWSAKNKQGYERVKAEAKKLKLALVPPITSGIIGAHDDPMLAEVSPAKGTPFKVSGGMARCASDHSVNLKNGNFESFSGSNPTGWQQRNLAGCLARDGANKHGGSSSLRASNMKSGAHIYQTVTVKPFRVYRISAWFRSQSLPTFRGIQFTVDGKTKLLDRRWRAFGTIDKWSNFGLTMQNWTKCIADFNSQNNSSVKISFWFAGSGYGTGTGGSIWMDDMVVEEVGLYEAMRRDDCPIVVKSADGSKTYKEGTDYTVDPKLNTFRGSNCYYEGYLKIPSGSAIQDGQTLKVDWYKYSDNYLYCGETNFCIPEAFTAMQDDVKRIDELFGQCEWSMLAHDEWRGAFQSDRCPLFPKATTAGQYMAGAMTKTVATARGVNNSKRELWLYNDMYDPYHNARSSYHLTQGGTANSWKGLDTSIVIVNWASQISQSYAFFMGLDPMRKGKLHRQIINVQGAAEVPNKIGIIKSLEARAGKRSVVGCNWVTWYKRYNHMALTANAFKKAGWWGNGPLPSPGVAIEERKVDNRLSSIGMNFLHGSGTCQIQYDLPYDSRVDLRMVDAQGRVVRKLVGKEQAMGTQRVKVSTHKVPAGVYFFDLRVNGQMEKRAKHVIM